MATLDAKALTSDPEGVRFLRSVLCRKVIPDQGQSQVIRVPTIRLGQRRNAKNATNGNRSA
jgi:hypothetical protein